MDKIKMILFIRIVLFGTCSFFKIIYCPASPHLLAKRVDDSLIVFLKDHEDVPIKFYKDGTTVNYDPDYNPFTHKEVWQVQDFEWHIANSGFTGQEENHVFEHYFIIEEMCVTVPILTEESDPAP